MLRKVNFKDRTLFIEEKYLEASDFLDPGLPEDIKISMQVSREITSGDYDEELAKLKDAEIVEMYITGLKKELALRGRTIS